MLHWIIGYGQQLAAKVQQRVAESDLAELARRYHTRDLAVILTRVRRGLMLAAGLQARLDRRAATGRDVVPVPVRYAKPRTGQRGQKPEPRAPRRTNIVDLPLDRLPTAEEIASELRRRPLGAILADICRDLGIVPSDLPLALRRELTNLVMEYGGNLVVLLFKESNIHLRQLVAAELRPPAAALALPPPALALACATGPP